MVRLDDGSYVVGFDNGYQFGKTAQRARTIRNHKDTIQIPLQADKKKENHKTVLWIFAI